MDSRPSFTSFTDLAVPRPVGNYYPTREAVMYQRINSTLTGDISTTVQMIALWTPSAQTRFVLRGLQLTAIVTTDLAGSVDDVLLLIDGGDETTGVIGTIGAYAKDYRRPNIIFNGERDYREGIISATKGNVLYLGANATISTGVIRVAGTVWGDERVN